MKAIIDFNGATVEVIRVDYEYNEVMYIDEDGCRTHADIKHFTFID